jgi:hypothetical protein
VDCAWHPLFHCDERIGHALLVVIGRLFKITGNVVCTDFLEGVGNRGYATGGLTIVR